MKYSIVDYQSIIASSHSMRIDADFFRPDYLEVQRLFERIGSKRLIDFHIEIKHPKEIARRYVNKGILFLRAQNVRPLSVDLTASPVFISEDDAERLKDNTIVYKDILLTRTGANFGQCAIYLETNQAIASSHTFIIKSGGLNPFLLTVFLNTRYGRTMINRGMYGGSQPEIAPYFLKQIPIPAWRRLQNGVERVYLRSQDLIESSKIKYGQAETLLLAELGLADWRPKQRLSFVTNFSAIQRAGRMDADYFQPKYDDIVDAIKSYHNGWDTLGTLVTMQKSIEVGSKEYLAEGIPFVRVSNLSPFEITEEKYISEDLYEGIKENQPRRGEILFTKDATPSIAYYLRDEPQRMIPSGGVLRLKTKADRMDGEFLTLALNSMITKEQATRDAGGSVIRHWRPDQIARVVVPIPPKEVQARISKKVVEAAKLRQESKRLLDCAKRSVEIAIEQDEETALEWLNNKTGKA